MTTTEEKIAVMQAYVEGKMIQILYRDGQYNDIDDPAWNWDQHDYRVKPEPRYFWVHRYTNGSIQVYDAPDANQSQITHRRSDRLEVIKVVEVLQ